ncbi:MAG: hypothetical protein U0587_09455 [Candidatus Binatia bacterium]
MKGAAVRSAPWSAFLAKHADAIGSVLSCFDRVLFRGYLPLMSGYAMADFLQRKQSERHTLKAFLLTQAERVKKHALSPAAASHTNAASGPTRKEELARQIAEQDGITDGLVCVFSVLEPCRTFALVWKEAHPFVRPAQRKCLQLYFCFLDRQLGLIHVKGQTWFPFPIHVYVNITTGWPAASIGAE